MLGRVLLSSGPHLDRIFTGRHAIKNLASVASIPDIDGGDAPVV